MEKIMKTFYTAVLLTVFLSGCATIIGDKTQLMPISSTPSDASIVITDETGAEIFKGLTPTSVTLQKSDGSYFGKKSFTIKISKEGYSSQLIPVTASANGWYIGGNLLFGGLIGYLIVDPFNGAMYTLSPEQVSASLGDKVAHNNNAEGSSVSIVLLQDIPFSMRDQMKALN